VFSFHQESLKLILVDEPPSWGCSVTPFTLAKPQNRCTPPPPWLWATLHPGAPTVSWQFWLFPIHDEACFRLPLSLIHHRRWAFCPHLTLSRNSMEWRTWLIPPSLQTMPGAAPPCVAHRRPCHLTMDRSVQTTPTPPSPMRSCSGSHWSSRSPEATTACLQQAITVRRHRVDEFFPPLRAAPLHWSTPTLVRLIGAFLPQHSSLHHHPPPTRATADRAATRGRSVMIARVACTGRRLAHAGWAALGPGAWPRCLNPLGLVACHASRAADLGRLWPGANFGPAPIYSFSFHFSLNISRKSSKLLKFE
jgi:hypothetical protein